MITLECILLNAQIQPHCVHLPNTMIQIKEFALIVLPYTLIAPIAIPLLAYFALRISIGIQIFMTILLVHIQVSACMIHVQLDNARM